MPIEEEDDDDGQIVSLGDSRPFGYFKQLE